MRRLLTIRYAQTLALGSCLLVSMTGFAQQESTGGERTSPVGRQGRTIDSLTARLQENLHDTDRVNTLNNLAWELKYANPDTAIILSSEALANAEAYEWQLGIANSVSRLGAFNFLKGDYPKALEYYFKALKLDEELNNKNSLARHLGNIGNIYNSQGDYPKALDYYFKSLKINEELDNKNYIAANLSNIGSVYVAQDDYPKALDYYFKSLKINEELGNNSYIAGILGNIGSLYYNQGDYPKALEYYFKTLKMNEELGNKHYLAGIHNNMGIIYKKQGDYSQALEYYLQSLKISEEVGNKNYIAGTLGHIGSLHTAIGEFENAENTLQRALTLSKEIGAKELVKSQYKSLTSLYETKVKPALAFEAYKLYIIYRDSIDNEENTKAQTRTEMKYEYEKAQLVKEQAEKEQARVLAEETSRRDNLQYSVILLGLLVLGSLVMGLGRLSLPIRMAEGLIFFSFLILFEFLLVLADPYIDGWSGGAPGIKLLFNAGIAAMIFPLHALFETKLKGRLVKQ